MRCFVSIPLFALALSWFGLAAPAQPRPGDFIANGGSAIHVVDAQTGKVSTLLTVAKSLGGPFVTAIVPAPKNAGVYALVTRDIYQKDSKSALLSVSPAGVATTVLTLGDRQPTGLAVDVDGAILFAEVSGLILARGASLTTVARLPVTVAHIRIDADTGDYLVSGLQSLSNGHVCRLDRTTYRVTTIRSFTGMNPPSVIDHDQKTGHIWHAGTLVHRDTGAPIRTVVSGVTALCVEQDTSNILFATTGAIQRRAPDGTLLRTWTVPGSWLSDLCRLGDRTLTGEGSIRPGNPFTVHVRFPRSPSALYCAALSLSGLRPGVSAFHKTLHINPDPLFWATACRDVPGFTSGFAGRLDATGAGTLTIRLPSVVQQAFNITVAAVAINGALPAGIDSGASLTLPLRPVR